MTTIVYRSPELIIALNRKIIFVNPNDLQIFKEVEIPEDLSKHGLILKSNKEFHGDAVKQKENKLRQEEIPSVQQACLSPNRQILAVTTSGQKALILYQCRPEHAKLVSVRPLARTTSALYFAHDSNNLLVTDKSGDCYFYSCTDLEAEPRLLFGHLSIVYDVLWSPNEKYIATCDRDDKIRVTNYPDTFDIHGYCLGHTEFVSALSYLEGTVMASVSGDKTLRLWNYETCQQLAVHELQSPGIKLVVRQIEENNYQAAVLLHQPNESVGIYDIRKINESTWEILERKLLSFPDMLSCNLCFVDARLYVTGIANEHLKLRMVSLEEIRDVPENWQQMVEDYFVEDTWIPEDIGAWFKRHYDNVSDYLERKKRRIEEKQK